jgi:hypothetical protein
MLSYPDRRNFERIRSQWEAAQPISEEPSIMVGRREKSIAQPPLPSDPSSGPSRFRRKLSQGLSLISNPLSQRKVTPARQTSGSSLPANRRATPVEAPLHREPDRPLSPIRDSPSSNGSPRQRTTPNDIKSTGKSLDPDATPKPLPRPRTMSFIPRPSGSGSVSSVGGPELTESTHTLTVTLKQDARGTPTKIPTPSPHSPRRRRSSPRQYVNALTTQQAKHVAAGNAFAGSSTESSSGGSVRSYTTPNLRKRAYSPQPKRFMAPRKSTARISTTGIPVPRKPTAKENAHPTSQLDCKRTSQIPEGPSNRDSLAASTEAFNRRSSGVNDAITQGKPSPATPPTARQRRSLQVVRQTPLTAQRALKKNSPHRPLRDLSIPNGNVIAQNRLMGPVNPPTPPSGLTVVQPALPRASTEKDVRRRTFTTPSKRFGVGVLSRGQVGVDNEVRLPRSSTFHALRQSPPPPMPSIPEQHKSFSLPILPFGECSLPPLPESRPADLHHCQENTAPVEDLLSSTSRFLLCDFASETPPNRFFDEEEVLTTAGEPWNWGTKAKAEPSFTQSFSNPLMIFSPRVSTSQDTLYHALPKTNQHTEFGDGTDVAQYFQVKDYMPVLYWAGRFQSRFDQWRTEAMKVELDPHHEISGQLGQLGLSQEKIAAYQILLQLRDLCISNQAADSLWVFLASPHVIPTN